MLEFVLLRFVLRVNSVVCFCVMSCVTWLAVGCFVIYLFLPLFYLTWLLADWCLLVSGCVCCHAVMFCWAV